MGIMDILDKFHAEMKRAERKHPGWPTDPVHAAAVLQEEAGELVQAALQFTYEGGSAEHMREEAVQVGAMALRFLLNAYAMQSRPSKDVYRPGVAI